MEIVHTSVKRFTVAIVLLGLAIAFVIIAATEAIAGAGFLSSDIGSAPITRVVAQPRFYAGRSATVTVTKAPVQAAPAVPSGSPWDCIAKYESGGQALPCAPFCGRLQWLPSTWRAAGGTKYAALPQNATWEQEKAVASAWLARTSWGQWPNTSRKCGLR